MKMIEPDVLGLLFSRYEEEANPWIVVASQVFDNGEVNLEVWGTFLSKADADVWIEHNKDSLNLVGDNIQIKQLRPVDGPITTLT